jgi:hypothetical protein
MRRAYAAVALLTVVSLAGCGGNSKPDYDPPAPPPAATPAPAPKVAPKDEPAPPKKSDEPEAKSPKAAAPKFNGAGPLALVPLPTTPAPVQTAPPSAPPSPLTTPPSPATPPAPKELAAKDEPKKEFEWPLAIDGRPLSEFIKDTVDTDPAIRQMALQKIPSFGPAARTAASKAVLARMDRSKERDPGVRATAFEAAGSLALLGKEPGLEEEADTREAIRLLKIAAEKDTGGGTRLHAIQTLASFGPKAESAIEFLVGQNMTTLEPAYETRRAVATTLGQIGFHERNGPSNRALNCLTDVLIKDHSAAVRLAAYQSIVMLGPPLVPRPANAILLKDIKDAKDIPKADDKALAGHISRIKARLQPWKHEPGSHETEPLTGLVERDRQVEIFARLALMRLDPVRELNDANLSGISKYAIAPGTDTGPKVQALSALAMMGESAAKKIDDVARAMSDENPSVATAAVMALVAMGPAAKPYAELVEKLKTRGSKKDEKDPKDYPNEAWVKLADDALKAIKEAKPAAVAMP